MQFYAINFWLIYFWKLELIIIMRLSKSRVENVENQKFEESSETIA